MALAALDVEIHSRPLGSIELLLNRLERIHFAFLRAPHRAVDESADILEEALEKEAPKRTGAFARGIYHRTEDTGDGARATFYDTQPYTPFVIEGTRPHEIRPRIKRALFWPGAPHPFARVHHPGTRASRFREEAMDRAMLGIRSHLRRLGREILDGEVV